MQLLTKLFELLIKNYKVAFATMLVTLALFSGTMKYMFGVTTVDLVSFVRDHEKSIDKVAKELKEINDMIDDAELESNKNQQDLLRIIQNQNQDQNKTSGPEFSRLLNLSNENQDIIRAQLEFGRIYATLVESREGNEKNYGYLSEMYQALLLITSDDPFDVNSEFNIRRQKVKEGKEKNVCGEGKPETKKSPICKAKNKLIKMRASLYDFPDIVRDNIKIEVLRYLSYCCARALETNNQIKYTHIAEQLLNDKNPNMYMDDPRLYRRQYYWIDYSRMMLLVMKGKPGYKEKAKIYFEKLGTGFVDDQGTFLKHKLMQHQHLIPEAHQSFWQELIREAGLK